MFFKGLLYKRSCTLKRPASRSFPAFPCRNLHFITQRRKNRAWGSVRGTEQEAKIEAVQEVLKTDIKQEFSTRSKIAAWVGGMLVVFGAASNAFGNDNSTSEIPPPGKNATEASLQEEGSGTKAARRASVTIPYGNEAKRPEKALRSLAAAVSSNGTYVMVTYGRSRTLLNDAKAAVADAILAGLPVSALMVGPDNGKEYAELYYNGQRQNKEELTTEADMTRLINKIARDENLLVSNKPNGPL